MEINEALVEVQNMLRQFRAFQRLEEILAVIPNIDERIEIAKKRLDEINEQVAKADEERKSILNELNKEQERFDNFVNSLNEKRSAMERRFVEAGKRLEDAYRNKENELRVVIGELENEIKQREARVVELNELIQSLESKHDGILRSISDLKEKLGVVNG